MAGLILLSFIVVPIAEIAVFIEAGKIIGVGWTIAIVFATAAAGTFLLRRQGLKVLSQTQARLNRGEMPVGEMFTGLCLLVAGALLLTPGFITDTLGLLLFVPLIRNAIVYFVLRRLVRSPGTHIWVNGEEVDIGGGGQGPVIDGEFTRVPPDGPANDDSPWRRKD